jgi:hypothetical protein
VLSTIWYLSTRSSRSESTNLKSTQFTSSTQITDKQSSHATWTWSLPAKLKLTLCTESQWKRPATRERSATANQVRDKQDRQLLRSRNKTICTSQVIVFSKANHYLVSQRKWVWVGNRRLWWEGKQVRARRCKLKRQYNDQVLLSWTWCNTPTYNPC